ncbi:hypothetical protein IFR05_007028 [Cadophora sp. M221]|nr:hypothetical protein IFR05_007028 [Cadophora sp. M221]
MASQVSMNALSQGTNAGISNDLWGKAIGNLKPVDQIAIRQTSTSTDRLQVLQDVLVLARTSEQTSLQKRWMWKNNKGEVIVVRDIFAKMIAWIEKVKGIGDTIVQYDPGHAALPWAAARLILQASINDIQTNGAMLEGMELTFNLIAKSEVIERLYLRRVSTLQAPLDKSLVALYTSILEFLLESHRYFGQKTIKRIAKSVFQVEEFAASFISKIEGNMKEVESYVRLISGEIASQAETSLTDVSKRMTRLDLQSRKLDNVDTQLASVRDLMETNMRLLTDTLEELNQPINRIATHIRTLDDNLKEDERLKIFNWLSTVEYRSHHRSKVKILLPGSGQWLLRKQEFREWMSRSTSSILWLHGIPGSGKSMLVAHVIEYLQARAQRDGGVAYFYCARTANEPERADPAELLRCLLEQMACLDESEPIQLPVVTAYNSRKKEARGRTPEKLGMDECAEVVIELLHQNPVTIVVDGLDECDPTRRQDLLDMFQQIINDANNIVKIFVSSRDDHDIVHRLSQVPNLYIGAVNNKEDIESFVTCRVSEAISKKRILCGNVSQDLRNTIVETLIRKAEGMFRLVSLHIQSLCDPSQIKNRANVFHTLDYLPLDLKQSYDTILAQISSSQCPNPEIADRVIKWLLYAQQSLPADAFVMAVRSDLADQDSLQGPDILSVCCNLVIYDDESNRFRFAHLSVLEYLEQLDMYSKMSGNALLAEQCLNWILTMGDIFVEAYTEYLVFPGGTKSLLWKDNPKSTAEIATNLFSGHADIYWAQYSHLAGPLRTQGRLRLLLEKFLLPTTGFLHGCSEQFGRWVDRLDIRQLFFQQDLVTSQPPNPLFVASMFNLTEIVATLVHKNSNALRALNSFNFNCGQIAARCDRPETVRIILEETNRLQFPSEYIKSAMFEAAQMGKASALAAILDLAGYGFVSQNDVEIYLTTSYGFVRHNYTNIMSLLFNNNRSIHVDERLLIAACGSYNGATIMQCLLNFADIIELTLPIIETALANSHSGSETLMILLSSGSTINLKIDVIEIVRRYNDEQWIDLLWDRWNNPSKGPRPVWKSPGKVILTRASSAGLDMQKPLLDIIHDFDSSAFRLSWEQLLILRKWKDGPELLLFILEEKPDMDAAAVNMLLSRWDEKAVEALLAFHDLEITDDVIKIVAGNLRYGVKVMELLLEKEAEMLDLMD